MRQETVDYKTLIFAFAALIIFGFLMMKITNYSGRMQAYNHHICVETYGLNDNCK